MKVFGFGLLFLSALMFLGCGVKGKPLPPLEPPVMGNGKPLMEKENLKKKSASEAKKPEEVH